MSIETWTPANLFEGVNPCQPACTGQCATPPALRHLCQHLLETKQSIKVAAEATANPPEALRHATVDLFTFFVSQAVHAGLIVSGHNLLALLVLMTNAAITEAQTCGVNLHPLAEALGLSLAPERRH